MHFYNYRKCSVCEHTFAGTSHEAAVKQYHNMHLRNMRMNGELLQQTLTLRHRERLDVHATEKLRLLDSFSPEAKRVLDLEGETGCLREKAETLTQLPHLRRHLDGAEFGSVLRVSNSFDAIVSYKHLEYEDNPIALSPHILAKLEKEGKWIVHLPIDNDIRSNYQGRIHEFSNDSAMLFASQVSYDFVSVNNGDSITLVFK